MRRLQTAAEPNVRPKEKMIQRFPILEYLSFKAGQYLIDNGPRAIHLHKAGYGFALQVDEAPPKSPTFGVIGVANGDLLLHSNVGLPNVIIFKWPHNFKEVGKEDLRIEFVNEEISISLALEFTFNQLSVSYISNRNPSKVIVGKKPSG